MAGSNCSGSGPMAGRCGVRPSATSRSTGNGHSSRGFCGKIGPSPRQLRRGNPMQRIGVGSHRTAIGMDQAGQHRQQGRFAGAIGADHRHELSRVKLEPKRLPEWRAAHAGR